MSKNSITNTSLGHDEIILRRTTNHLGVSWLGLQGSLAGGGYRVLLRAVFPSRISVQAKFPIRSAAITNE